MRNVDPMTIDSGPSMIEEDTRGAEYGIPVVRDLLRVIRQRFWIILFSAILFTGIAVGFSIVQKPMYEASIKILIGQNQGITETPAEVVGLQQLTQTMVEAVNSLPVAEAVIQQLNLRTTPKNFLNNLSVEQVGATQFIEVSYKDPDPRRAQLVANTIGEVFSEQISEVGSNTSTSTISATVWERAVKPGDLASPDLVRTFLVALVVGLMLGVVLAFLLEVLDDRWPSPEEGEQISGVPTFGVIPKFEESKKSALKEKIASIFRSRRKVILDRSRDGDIGHYPSRELVTVREPLGTAAEAYRTLRTKLLYAFADQSSKVVTLTSPDTLEGKSTTCANVGVILAQADKEVLILDCDFRKPRMHRIFGLRNLWGVVDVLMGEQSLQEIWQEPLPGLKVGTTGSIPVNPAELLGSEPFAELLNQARQEFDYVLMDVSPTQLTSDALILSPQGDGVLLVIDAQNTPKKSVLQSIRNLEAVGAQVLGMVMNNVATSEVGHVGYYSYDYTHESG
jgi:receptor protein-tyrosine kinase